MLNRLQANAAIVAAAGNASATGTTGEALNPIALPPPKCTDGKPLAEALQSRHSTREYSDRRLPLQTLSDLLWSAFRVNRSDGERTAPYWRHVLVMDIYTAMSDGVWLYEPKTHTLVPHLRADIRSQTGTQDFVASAPLNLIYVAHGERMHDINAEERRLYASVDAAFIGQKVCLFCASQNLATVFRGAVDTASSVGRCNCRINSSSPSRRRWDIH